MTAEQFDKFMKDLAAGSRRPLSPQSCEVYWQQLGEIPYEVFKIAAAQALNETLYNDFPSIALLSSLSARVMMGQQIDPQEAWAMALNASRRMRLDEPRGYLVVRNGVQIPVEDWNRRILDELPSTVAHALACFAGRLNDTDTGRAQFRDAYKAAVAKVEKHLALPAPIREKLAELTADSKASREIEARGQVPNRVSIALQKVGKEQ